MIRIGTSGWVYSSWRTAFYPRGLPTRAELEHIAGLMNPVEINATFCRLQSPDIFRLRRARTPDGFVFAVKGSRFITHQKQPGDAEAAALDEWAARIRGWLVDGAEDVFVYFDNDARVRAPFDALELAGRFERTNFERIPAA